MKQIILILLFATCIANKSKAQLDIVGMPTLCGSVGVMFTVYDLNCNTYRSKAVTVTAGNTYPINLASPTTYVSGIAPPGVYGVDYWVIHALVKTQCMGTPVTPIICPRSGSMDIEDATTGLPGTCTTSGYPQNSCFEYGNGCSCPAGTVVSASIGAGGPGQEIIIQ